MKTNHVLFLILFAVFISCQQEETVTNPEQQNDVAENWKKVTPEKVFTIPENGFSISKEAIERALSLPEVTTIRFVLEVNDAALQIRIVGADQRGNTTEGMLATPILLEKTINKLFDEKSTRFEKSIFSKSVASHIMQPEDAVAFISRWQQQFTDQTLETAVGYNGVRIEHFSMPAAVGEQMLLSSSESINLVWGVNPEGKFTTIFLPELDQERRLFKNNELIFEYLTPCPPTCPPN